MKNAKKSLTSDPTLQDVLEAVQGGFTKVEERLVGVEHRLGEVEGRLDGVEYRMMSLERRTGSLEHTVEDMNETGKRVARARDKDSVVVISHERRIRTLEKARSQV